MKITHIPFSPSICEGLYVEDLFQFDRPGIGSTLMYSAIEGVLLLFLVVAIEVCSYDVVKVPKQTSFPVV